MTKKNLMRISLFLLILTIFSQYIFISAEPENNTKILESGNGNNKTGASDSYSEYLSRNNAAGVAAKDIFISAADISANDPETVLEADYNGSGSALLWNKGKIETLFQVEEPGLYNIGLKYCAAEAGVDFRLGFKINGQYPFEEASSIVFSRMYQNASDQARFDTSGNELTPEQIELTSFTVMKARDRTGINVDPYLFYFTAGTHLLEIESDGQPMAIGGINLNAPEAPEKYGDTIKQSKSQASDNLKTIYIQGEGAAVKSSSSLIPKSDSFNAFMTPVSEHTNKLNYIGGTSWQEPGESLTWDFVAEESGYYSFSARYRQSDVINAESWRWLKIDGITPFEEAKALRFEYCPSWKYFDFTGDGEAYYFWIEKGKHTLSLEVSLGRMADYYNRLSAIVEDLGDKYIEIVKITGINPDINLDYELFNQVPDLNETLKKNSVLLKSLVTDLSDFTGKRGSQYIAAMKSMTRVIQKMLNSPYVAQHFLADYYSNYSSLSSWLNEMKVMPLYIDELQLIPQGQRPDKKDKNILKSIWYTVKRLLLSFQNDYVNIENKYTADNQLKLWINWGRDQSAVLDSLIKDSFTPESGVFVKLEITNASLVNGILSGNAPDIALNLARTEPINLGMRDALVDLSHFSDLDGVLERFQPDAEIPYRLNSALYALPETQSFYTMFYRKDIFDSLELTVPTTWTEFLSTASVIQRNNMEVYIPYTMITDSTIVNSGIGSLNLFATLIGQSGLSLYNSGQNATALDNPDAISVFDYWIRLYKDYEFLKEADFYNRFRVGVMPLGISHYSTYMTLYSAAPELQGRWEIACVPGLSEDKNSIAGAGTGCAIVKSSKNSDGAWEFLKWWTSAGTQTKYSNNVESLLGMLGRPQTATVEAFENLGLDKNHKEILLEQWSRVKEIPEVPGGYYLSRALDQAFWAVINKETGIKDSIVKWSKIADAEIKRKIKEYS